MKKFLKEFAAGLLLLLAFASLAGAALLLSPLLILLGLVMRLAVGAALVIAAIWLLGKCVILLWEKFR